MSTIRDELVRALYLARRRGIYNRPLDKAKSHGTPYQPRHCGCQACSHGFTHVATVGERPTAEEFGRHRYTCAKLRDNDAPCDCGGYR